jgi:hypothetical protein
MRIRITNEHITHLVLSRSMHVLAIYGFVVVVEVVVVWCGNRRNLLPDAISNSDLERFGLILPVLVMGVWPPGVYFFGCVIAPVTGARGAFLRLARAVTRNGIRLFGGSSPHICVPCHEICLKIAHFLRVPLARDVLRALACFNNNL